MPQTAIELDDLLTFRISTKQRAAIEAYAKAIEAPRSYAIRRLVAAGLASGTESGMIK